MDTVKTKPTLLIIADPMPATDTREKDIMAIITGTGLPEELIRRLPREEIQRVLVILEEEEMRRKREGPTIFTLHPPFDFRKHPGARTMRWNHNRQLGVCPHCNGRVVETAVSKKPRCVGCKKLVRQGG